MMSITPPSPAEGIDLSHHAMGKGGTNHEAAHPLGMGSTAAWTDGLEWRAVRDQEFTYEVYHSDHKELLFDHCKDPTN